MKRQVEKTVSWQNGMLMKWQAHQMARCQKSKMAK
jgi:hypothetical protein